MATWRWTAAEPAARPLPARCGGETLPTLADRGPPPPGIVGAAAGGAAGGAAAGGAAGSEETEVEPTACKFGGAGCSFPFDEERPGAEAPTEILIVRSSGTAATPGTTAGQEAAGSLAAGLEAAEAAGRIYSSVGEAVRAARAGALVLISPGTYVEVAPLLLDISRPGPNPNPNPNSST